LAADDIIKKCSILQIGKHGNGLPFKFENVPIAQVNVVKDLGVYIDDQLKFGAHIRFIVSRAFQRANLILKCFYSKDTKVLARAFEVYVRPILEYASCIWSPYLIKDIKLVESVQKRFTKRIPKLRHLSYAERLKQLGFETLELRRLHCDLIYTYKILFGHLSIQPNLFCNSLCSVTRGHPHKMFVSRCNSDVRKNFFSNRIILPWNELRLNADNLRSLNSFKSFIDTCNFDKYLRVFFSN
jgi:hypothetical protein